VIYNESKMEPPGESVYTPVFIDGTGEGEKSPNGLFFYPGEPSPDAADQLLLEHCRALDVCQFPPLRVPPKKLGPLLAQVCQRHLSPDYELRTQPGERSTDNHRPTVMASRIGPKAVLNISGGVAEEIVTTLREAVVSPEG